jgi:N-acetylglucosaminyldiphosphoundecaprenol N-acetyl-beta-D-mannosaminyltransferase
MIFVFVDFLMSARDRFNYLGLSFDRVTMKQAVERLEEFVASGRPHMVFTPNAELIVRSQSESNLAKTYRETDLLTVDSYVAFYAARLLGHSLAEPVSAARLMVALLSVASRKKYKFYLLGAKADVVAVVAKKLPMEYPGIDVVGYRDGYFKKDEEAKIVSDIAASKADFLFVAMSTPFKENFIHGNLVEMNVPVCMGVGGTFDILAGRTKFAPAWLSRMGLEWLYRLAQEPRRLWRRYLFTNLDFIRLVARELLTRGAN